MTMRDIARENVAFHAEKIRRCARNAKEGRSRKERRHWRKLARAYRRDLEYWRGYCASFGWTP